MGRASYQAKEAADKEKAGEVEEEDKDVDSLRWVGETSAKADAPKEEEKEDADSLRWVGETSQPAKEGAATEEAAKQEAEAAGKTVEVQPEQSADAAPAGQCLDSWQPGCTSAREELEGRHAGHPGCTSAENALDGRRHVIHET